jgi:hypothetical protein
VSQRAARQHPSRMVRGARVWLASCLLARRARARAMPVLALARRVRLHTRRGCACAASGSG